MRVVMVSPWEPWRLWDGSCLVLHHHLRCLAERHEITLITPAAPWRSADIPGGPSTVPEGVRLRSAGRPLPTALDYGIRRLRSEWSREPAHVHWVERREVLAALAEEIGRGADMLHLFGWGTAQLWRRAGGTPTVHVAVDPWSPNMGNRDLPAWRAITDAGQARKVAAHERRHYPRLGAVVVVAPRDAEHLRRAAPGTRVEVIPNGVEPGPPPAPRSDAPVLGFHGAFEARANQLAAEVLVRDVLPRVQERCPSARVLLVGRGPTPTVRRLAGPAVEVTGEVPDVRPWLDQVAVYLAPMTRGAGLKNKVLEAMAAGLPVVATPAALDGIGEEGGVISAPTPPEMAEAALALLADPVARAAAGDRARERVVSEFTWERSAQVTEALWQDVVRRHRTTPLAG